MKTMQAGPVHMSLDLETFGTEPGSIIRSIGAVMFDPFASDQANANMAVFYVNVGHPLPDDLRWDEFRQLWVDDATGLTASQDTIEWWHKQTVEAKRAFDDGRVSLEKAIEALEQFWHETGAKYVWSYGANFDVVLVEEAIRLLNTKHRRYARDPNMSPAWEASPPWSYKDVRCVRTLLGNAGLDMSDFPNAGTLHNAIDDARAQARAVSAMLRKQRDTATQAFEYRIERDLAKGEPTKVMDREGPLDRAKRQFAEHKAAGLAAVSIKPADDDDEHDGVERTQETRRQPGAIDDGGTDTPGPGMDEDLGTKEPSKRAELDARIAEANTIAGGLHFKRL